MIFTLPSSSTRMFSGLRSRWHTPLAWQYLTASTICLKQNLAFSQGKYLAFLSKPAKLCFPPLSISNSSFFLSLKTCNSWITFRCCNFFRCLIYLLMLSKRCQSSASILSQVLIAQLALVSFCTADDTTEKQPFPICEMTRQTSSTPLSDRYLSKYTAFCPRLRLPLSSCSWHFLVLQVVGIREGLRGIVSWVLAARVMSSLRKGMAPKDLRPSRRASQGLQRMCA